ncbi:MAG: Amino acid/amide transporter rane protein 1 family [Rhodoferax sp.]|nr:Amino acid/amide transporter rane protein 1 family [Rhodoferax sp.]
MTAMIEQMLVNGLLSGFVYIIMALGFTLIFGIMRIVNFAHGELYMVSGFAMLVFYGMWGLNYFVALVLAVLVTAAVGALLERLLFRRFVGRELNGMIMSLALAIILQSIALIAFGPSEQSIPRPVTGVWRLHEAVISLDRGLVSLVSLVALAGFYLFMKTTRLGLAMQAVAQDRDTASLMGVESGSIYLGSFAIGSGLAGVAGALMAPIYTIGPYMGELPLLKAFVVVILGGLGSVPGAMVGGLLIGLVESVFATLFNSTIALIASFVMVLLIIIVRPSGLLGRAVR